MNKIIDKIIIIFCVSVYAMLAGLFIYAGIDALGNFGWITIIVGE
jgi:hypothetical protein